MKDTCRAGQNLEIFWRLSCHFNDALDPARTVLDADDVWVLGERDNFGRFECDAGKDGHGIEKDRNRRSVCDTAIVTQINLGPVSGLVVVGSFGESELVAEGRCPPWF